MMIPKNSCINKAIPVQLIFFPPALCTSIDINKYFLPSGGINHKMQETDEMGI